MNYDAILVTSFGGPEGPDDVMPFLENVLRGKYVPRERMLEVAEHYYHFGGKSPINDQNRLLIAALEAELAQHGPRLPIYWGNRNWHPMLTDTLCQMKADGVPCTSIRDVRLQFVLELPAVPRRHSAGTRGDRRGCAGGGQDSRVPQPSWIC